jgi:hypothetical protein
MRIKDLVTPEELKQIFVRELNDVRALGNRFDLKVKYIREISNRLDDKYVFVLDEALVGDNHAGAQILRVLCLIDRFLEEKYANSNRPTN